MADISIGKFINNLDKEDLSSEDLQGVVNNVYAKAISDHKKLKKAAEDNTKEQDKETATFVKANHDRLKANKDKVAKDINESFERKLEPGDSIVVGGTRVVIGNILDQYYDKNYIDIEFEDENGNYRSWKSDVDGGKVVYKVNESTYRKFEIEEVSPEELNKIIGDYEPRGLFVAKEGKVYVAVDNSTGDAWTEEFKTKSEAIKWLKGADSPGVWESKQIKKVDEKIAEPIEYLGKRSSAFGFTDDKTAEKELKKRFPDMSKEDMDKVIKRWNTGKLPESKRINEAEEALSIDGLIKELKKIAEEGTLRENNLTPSDFYATWDAVKELKKTGVTETPIQAVVDFIGFNTNCVILPKGNGWKIFDTKPGEVVVPKGDDFVIKECTKGSFRKSGKRLTEAEDGNMTIETSTSILDMFYPSLYQTIDDYYIPDGEWDTVDDILARTSMDFAEDAIKEVFPSATLKFKELIHPRQYNFGGENIIFDVTLPRADYERVKQEVAENPEFAQFLKKNSPRDGYIPFGAYTVDKFKTQDDMYSIGQIVKFFADNEDLQYDFDDKFREEIGSNFETYDYLWEEVMDWLKEHDQAYQDFLTHFNADENSVIDLDSIIGWISDHDTLAQDFENYFGFSINESLVENYKGADAIEPGDFYKVAIKELPAEDIDHHESDLYIRKTPKSTELIKKLTTDSLLSTFKSNIDGDIWYELPFCYSPFWQSKNNIKEGRSIPRNATKIKVGGKEFTKDGDWVDDSRVHVSPRDIKRFYGDDVEVLETDPNYKPKRTKEVKVLQGNYGYGWDDLVEYEKEDYAELRQDLKSYRENEKGASFRVVTRRVPLGESRELGESIKERYKDTRKQAAYENACDCIIYGYGKSYWNSLDLNDEEKKEVWKQAYNDLAETESLPKRRLRKLKESEGGRFEPEELDEIFKVGAKFKLKKPLTLETYEPNDWDYDWDKGSFSKKELAEMKELFKQELKDLEQYDDQVIDKYIVLDKREGVKLELPAGFELRVAENIPNTKWFNNNPWFAEVVFDTADGQIRMFYNSIPGPQFIARNSQRS